MGTILRGNHKETFQGKFVFQENLYYLLQRNKGLVIFKKIPDGSIGLKGNGRDRVNLKHFLSESYRKGKKHIA